MLAIDRIESNSNDDDSGNHSTNRCLAFHDGISITTSENICRILPLQFSPTICSHINISSYFNSGDQNYPDICWHKLIQRALVLLIY